MCLLDGPVTGLDCSEDITRCCPPRPSCNSQQNVSPKVVVAEKSGELDHELRILKHLKSLTHPGNKHINLLYLNGRQVMHWWNFGHLKLGTTTRKRWAARNAGKRTTKESDFLDKTRVFGAPSHFVNQRWTRMVQSEILWIAWSILL